ncbi:eukaryotic translation initiation factor 5B-like [Schistocerca americana]|uniref:eukaryotic translation initiation factor 5B-like n=1 Tax=Schistocerca americana TaxID=7009 RepID=UPI001F4F16B6|nr:eukaryotic translation initiation factor 5B-like [Schistocerca americana]
MKSERIVTTVVYSPFCGFEPNVSALDRLVQLMEEQKRSMEEQKRSVDEQKRKKIRETKESLDKFGEKVDENSRNVSTIEGEFVTLKEEYQKFEERLDSIENFEKVATVEVLQLKKLNKEFNKNEQRSRRKSEYKLEENTLTNFFNSSDAVAVVDSDKNRSDEYGLVRMLSDCEMSEKADNGAVCVEADVHVLGNGSENDRVIPDEISVDNRQEN